MNVLDNGYNKHVQIYKRGKTALLLNEVKQNHDGSKYLVCDCVKLEEDGLPVLLSRISIFKEEDGYGMRLIDGYMNLESSRKFGDVHKKLFNDVSARTLDRFLAMSQAEHEELISE